MDAFLASLVFVILAEMGDKTQLLAMALATRFKAGKVLTGVFIATLLNHALAVAAGYFFRTVLPMDIISLAAALSFILFGLWTIRGDTLEGEDEKKSRFGPVLTVAIVFFLAELGDKTQLATISLAVEYKNVFAVLMGTTLAMVIADSIGIVVAIVLGKNLPEKIIKGISAAVFILFGFYGVHKVLTNRVPMTYLTGVLGLIIGLTAYAAYYLINRTKKLVPAPINGENTLAEEDSSQAV